MAAKAGQLLPGAARRAAPAAGEPTERILRAVAGERGYLALGVAEIAARARLSQQTFYAHFSSKEEAVPAARRAPDFGTGVHAAISAICAYGASEPGFAALASVEVYVMGPSALELRERSLAPLREMLCDSAPSPKVSATVAEALSGACYTLAYDQVRLAGAAELPPDLPDGHLRRRLPGARPGTRGGRG